jgi:hypothetical protein
VLRVLGAAGVVALLLVLPWRSLWSRYAVVSEIRVEGLHYLDAEQVARIAGVERGQPLLRMSCARARQALLMHSRVASAEVTRLLPRGVRMRIVERLPVLLVRHGLPREMDSTGVLLAPLAEGVVADVPLLAGATFERVRDGARIRVEQVERGLAWVRALSASELGLSGQVSEIDVGDSLVTGLHLMAGTRVLGPAWPPGMRTLSALRVVLVDLEHRGALAREVDLRFLDQVIVRGEQEKDPHG